MTADTPTPDAPDTRADLDALTDELWNSELPSLDHEEAREFTKAEIRRLLHVALAAERDRADRAEAVIAKALYICHNYGTRDPLPANLYKTLKPYDKATA